MGAGILFHIPHVVLDYAIITSRSIIYRCQICYGTPLYLVEAEKDWRGRIVGLVQRFTKPPWPQGYREFESRPLRLRPTSGTSARRSPLQITKMGSHVTLDSMKKLLVVYTVILILWTLYRLLFHLPEWVDEWVAKPILWLGPLVLSGQLTGHMLHNQLKKTTSYNIILGLIGGFLYFAVYRLITRQTAIVLIPGMTLFGVATHFLITFATGLTEELTFRLVFLDSLTRLTKDNLGAILISSFLFVGIHFPIMTLVYHYTFVQIVSYSSVLLISSFVYSGMYLYKKSVGSSAITHAVWNVLGNIVK